METLTDGKRWRSLGEGWVGLLPRTADLPMTLLDLEGGTRQELWPTDEHKGLLVLLPGGEVGRLLRLEHSPDSGRWTWALEFRGERAPVSLRS